MTNKEIAKAWFAAIDKREFEKVKGLMHPAHKFHNPMTPAPAGTEEHIGMMQMMTSAFSGQHELELILEEGKHIAVRGRWKGRHTGEFNGVPATGKTVEFTFTDIFEISEGKVRREDFEMNPMAIMAQVSAPVAG
jgi:predicted ester cyclase